MKFLISFFAIFFISSNSIANDSVLTSEAFDIYSCYKTNINGAFNYNNAITIRAANIESAVGLASLQFTRGFASKTIVKCEK